MPNRLFWGQAPRALVETPLPNARLRVFANRTTTQVPVTDAAGNVLSQPLESYADGTFDPIYRATGEPVRILLTDANDIPLPGYPLDDCLIFSTEGTGAAGVPFDPTEGIPQTNVQDAIEAVAAIASGQNNLLSRTLTFWTTGGSGPNYTISPSPAVSTYAIGQGFHIVPNRENPPLPAIASLNVNGRGATTLCKPGRDGYPISLEGGELQPGQPVMVLYDGLQWVIAGQTPNSGNNIYGYYCREASGLMVCRSIGVRATFATVAQLSATWTFPARFARPPVVSVSLPGASQWTGIVPAQVGAIRQDRTNFSASIAIPRAQGAADFEDGDVIAGLQITAIGEWY